MDVEKEILSLKNKTEYRLEDLLRIMEILRSDRGCPWDRAQGHKDLRKNLIEEAYEVADAIDREDPVSLREELGDLLLQIVFHAQMEKEKGVFDFDGVANDISLKMIRRHPHIFGEEKITDAAGSYDAWEQIKREEKGARPLSAEMDGVAKTLPSLVRAEKLLKKAAKAGAYTLDGVAQVYLAQPTDTAKSAMLADLRSICAAAALMDIDLEEALYFENEALIVNVREKENG